MFNGSHTFAYFSKIWKTPKNLIFVLTLEKNHVATKLKGPGAKVGELCPRPGPKIATNINIYYVCKFLSDKRTKVENQKF